MTLRSHGDYSLVRGAGGLFVTAGFTARRDGVVVHRGVLGGGATMADARSAASLATSNGVAALRAEFGTDAVQVIQLTVFVRAAGDVPDLSVVGDAATEVIREQLAQTVPPARAVIGVSALPGDSLVEVTMTGALIG